MSQAESRAAVVAALTANLGIAVAKFVGFVITASGSLLAEAGHSLADSGNQALLLVGDRRARRAADPDRPFGYTRERYFYPFLVAVILFTAGAGFAAREGFEKLTNPHELESVGIAIGILVVAIGLEGFSLRTAVKAANPVRRGRRWWRYVRQSKNAELSVVLLEDTAALAGLAIALTGVVLAAITGDAVWDAIGTIAIACLLAAVAVVMAIESKSLLIGEAASADEIAAIERAINESEDLEGLLFMRTEQRGPDEIIVAAKVAVRPRTTTGTLARAIDETERRIREAVPAARYIFIEPDLRRENTEGS
jgi:cation diffusion facilitator family transporter